MDGTAGTKYPGVPDECYPQALKNLEAQLVVWRRSGGDRPPEAGRPQGMVGLALSGGGIRSATISLGILQAFARSGWLRSIDYISSVSGGGYLATCLGGLFMRRPDAAVTNAKNEEATKPARTEDWKRVEDAMKGETPVIAWLRENGRYLAPNGAGDLSLAIAIVLRNLVALHVVLSSLVLALMLTLNGIRLLVTKLIRLSDSPFIIKVSKELYKASIQPGFWYSPYCIVPIAALCLWVFPMGLAYWLVRSDERYGQDRARGRWTPLFVLSIPLVGSLYGMVRAVQAPVIDDTHLLVAGGLSAMLLSSGVLRLGAGISRTNSTPERTKTLRSMLEERLGVRRGVQARYWLTRGLEKGLIFTLATAAIALLDSAGQTLCAIWFRDDTLTTLTSFVAGGFSIVATFALFAQRVSGLIMANTNTRMRLPMGVIASVCAAVLTIAMTLGLVTSAHMMTWRFSNPKVSPAVAPASVVYELTTHDGVTTVRRPEKSCAAADLTSGEIKECNRLRLARPWTPQAPSPLHYLSALITAWLLTLIFGWRYSFINRSALTALYSARLARAYLGASNPERRDPTRQLLTELLDQDEMDLDQYAPHEHGGPLSIINITVNETIDGRSQVQQRDRKGTGMAVGPAGVSVGIRHHATWESDPPRAGGLISTATNTENIESYCVFPTPEVIESKKIAVQPHWPTLGRMIAISGAAVSTGLGARTSLALSLLLGLFNVRLGHWWRSGVDPKQRLVTRPTKPAGGASKPATAATPVHRRPWLQRFTQVLPVQRHLFHELTGRFPGTSEPDWYLSDGGHFENTGAYELIRRRVDTIILCDNGADPKREFGDLGNLVLKVRNDFGAHIRFLSDAELSKYGDLKDVVGTLGQLGFCGRLEQALIIGNQGANAPAQEPLNSELPTRYAALAQITYDSDPSGKGSLLMVLRPAVLGGEPLDVLNYQVVNPDFPQQSTADQFFDEAQWEAHRRLGDFMATRVLSRLRAPDSKPENGWIPIAAKPALVGG